MAAATRPRLEKSRTEKKRKKNAAFSDGEAFPRRPSGACLDRLVAINPRLFFYFLLLFLLFIEICSAPAFEPHSSSSSCCCCSSPIGRFLRLRPPLLPRVYFYSSPLLCVFSFINVSALGCVFVDLFAPTHWPSGGNVPRKKSNCAGRSFCLSSRGQRRPPLATSFVAFTGFFTRFSLRFPFCWAVTVEDALSHNFLAKLAAKKTKSNHVADVMSRKTLESYGDLQKKTKSPRPVISGNGSLLFLFLFYYYHLSAFCVSFWWSGPPPHQSDRGGGGLCVEGEQPPHFLLFLYVLLLLSGRQCVAGPSPGLFMTDAAIGAESRRRRAKEQSPVRPVTCTCHPIMCRPRVGHPSICMSTTVRGRRRRGSRRSKTR